MTEEREKATTASDGLNLQVVVWGVESHGSGSGKRAMGYSQGCSLPACDLEKPRPASLGVGPQLCSYGTSSASLSKAQFPGLQL